MSRRLSIAKTLGITPEEADKIIAQDEAIDKGERLNWEMSEEEEIAIKKEFGVKVDKVRSTPNNHTVNKDKEVIMNDVFKAVEKYDNEATIKNERIISFVYNNCQYSLVLTKHH